MTGDLPPDCDYQRRLRALLRASANDLKRNDEAADAELGLPAGTFADCTAGRAPITWEILRRISAEWPVNERDLLPVHDDCVNGVRLCRAVDSAASARVIDRGGLPYYEYRDTAMSRLSTFRPEWIKMLRVVDNDDPHSDAIEWNSGHLLYQFTYFVGPVNYYFYWNGAPHCLPMRTGDSVFGVPFAPHSFAARSGREPAYILALTYGGDLLGDAQRELAVLGNQKAARFALTPSPYGHPRAAQAQLLRDMLDARAMPWSVAAARARLPAARLEEILSGVATAQPAELDALSEMMDVNLRELLPVSTQTLHGIRVQYGHTAARWTYYGPNEAAAYEFTRLAGDAVHPHTTALQARVLLSGVTAPAWLTTYQHQYLYVLSGAAVRMTWRHGAEEHATLLDAGDSAYITPLTPVAFTTSGKEALLLLLRVGGAVTTDVRFALGTMAAGGLERYVAEDRLWYQDRGE